MDARFITASPPPVFTLPPSVPVVIAGSIHCQVCHTEAPHILNAHPAYSVLCNNCIEARYTSGVSYVGQVGQEVLRPRDLLACATSEEHRQRIYVAYRRQVQCVPVPVLSIRNEHLSTYLANPSARQVQCEPIGCFPTSLVELKACLKEDRALLLNYVYDTNDLIKSTFSFEDSNFQLCFSAFKASEDKENPNRLKIELYVSDPQLWMSLSVAERNALFFLVRLVENGVRMIWPEWRLSSAR